MQYTLDAPPVRQLDVADTPTVNGTRYSKNSDVVLLNSEGLPVAFREIRVLKPGTFAGATLIQLVTPRQVVDLERPVYKAWRGRCHPLN